MEYQDQLKRDVIPIPMTSVANQVLGWFKRPERENFARFTDPIYQDRPTVIVARAHVRRRQVEPVFLALLGPAQQLVHPVADGRA